jgi:hypothetical protein
MRQGFLFSIIVLITFCTPVLAYDWSTNPGDGSEANPYQISTPEQLVSVGLNTNSQPEHYLLGSSYILTNDLDMDPTVTGIPPFEKAVIAADLKPSPYGFGGLAFTGSFYGRGHVIRNLNIDSSDHNDYLGLFGMVSHAKIQNLGIVNILVNGYSGTTSSRYCGGLAGWVDYSTVIQCFVTGGIKATTFTGGLIGYCYYGRIYDCYSVCSVIGEGYTEQYPYPRHYDPVVGGLIGYGYFGDGEIESCYSAGLVTGNGNSAGGLFGESNYKDDARIISCLWDIQASSKSQSAGGVGYSTTEMKSLVTYNSHYWNPDIWTIDDGNDYPHLAWENADGTPITGPYSLAHGTGTQEDPYLVYTIEDFRNLSNSPFYWDGYIKLMADLDANNVDIQPIGFSEETSFSGVFEGEDHIIKNLHTQPSLFGYISKTAEISNLNINIKSPNGSFGEFNEGRIDHCSVTGFGYLLAVNRDRGRVTNSFSICTLTSRAMGAGLVRSNYGAIINCYALGSLKKVGHTTYTAHTGGLVAENISGSIINCYSDFDIDYSSDKGSYKAVGGLVGHNYGRIQNCHSTGTIIGVGDVGGLVGENVGYTIEDSYSTASVYGDYRVGGVVGYNTGRVHRSYFKGDVRGNYYVGGIAGNGESPISDCYSSGSIEGIRGVGGIVGVLGRSLTNCYSTCSIEADEDIGGIAGLIGKKGSWENCYFLDTSATDNGCGVALTDAEMKKVDSFVDWDFESIWWIDEWNDYPRLWWEFTNTLPVADAGPEQVVYAFFDGYACVTLDGTDSYDDDEDALEYFWYDGNELIATGAEPNVMLPVGEHVIDLIVNDGIEDSEPNDVVITVIQALKIPMNLTPRTLNCRSQGNWTKAHFALPEEYSISDIDPDRPAVVHELGIESALLEVSVNKEKSVEITASFAREQICSLAGDWPEVFRVYGFFTDGSVFFGESVIRINPAGLKEVSELAMHWMGECESPKWCEGMDMNRDTVVNLQDYPLLLNSEVEFTAE